MSGKVSVHAIRVILFSLERSRIMGAVRLAIVGDNDVPQPVMLDGEPFLRMPAPPAWENKNVLCYAQARPSRGYPMTKKPAAETRAQTLAKDQLLSIIERVERLTEERNAISDDIRDVFAEAKGNGFDAKALRAIIKIRQQDPIEREADQAILETYMQALGL